MNGLLIPINKFESKLSKIVSNPNLLDNGWFTVNQRGVTTATSGYFVDRWGCVRANITCHNDGTNGIALAWDGVNGTNGCIYQKIEKKDSFIGKIVTISVNVNGIIKSASIKITDNTEVRFGDGDLFYYDTRYSYIQFNVYSYSIIPIVISAIKLELGNISTLANDIAPNYAEELAKCQRYFVRLAGTQYYNSIPAFAYTTTKGECWFPVPVNMRTTPAITSSGTWYFVQEGQAVRFNDVHISANKIQLYFETTGSNFTVGAGYLDPQSSGANYIDLSADL